MKIGLLFPGYGSQFIGMAKELYDSSRIVQEYFEEASNCLDINFVKLCFASSDTELSRMDNAYPAIFLVSSALSALLKEQAIVPSVVAGCNQGEFAAIYAAGGFTFPDGLYLLSKYATLYAELLSSVDTNGIRVKGLAYDHIQEGCQKATKADRWAQVALRMLPYEHVVMGHPEAIERVREFAMEYPNVDVDDADIELGLHAPVMDTVVTTLKMYSEKVDFKDLAIPLVANADAKVVTQGQDVKTALMKQLQSPVLWYDCMAHLVNCDGIIEVGPGTGLSAVMQALYPQKFCLTLNNAQDLEEIQRMLYQGQGI